ncbi:MAG TPA: alpha/beta hydrolase [Candidatus Limnocylindrales bacterium]|nr:alpha/beta hydrolase [Candidatus Limnocylindrales bacterium]
MPGSDLHVERWGDAGDLVILVHGSFGWGSETFSAQRPLAERYRLRLVDRRGFGASPARPGGVDFEPDAVDVAGLLDEPAHLVGHSYGGVVTLLAAARRPAAVRSLTVVEPPAFGVARGDPAVERFLERLRAVWPARAGQSEEGFRAAFGLALGRSGTAGRTLSDADRRATRASMGERDPGEAEIPFDALRARSFPTLVARGRWDIDPASAAIAGAAFAAVCRVLVERLAASEAIFAGAAHAPQLLGPPFNDRLDRFFRTGR